MCSSNNRIAGKLKIYQTLADDAEFSCFLFANFNKLKGAIYFFLLIIVKICLKCTKQKKNLKKKDVDVI